MMINKIFIQISVVLLVINVSLFAQITKPKNTLSETDKIISLLSNARNCTYKGSDSCFYYADLAKKMALKIKFTKGVANSYLEYGEFYNAKGDYELSLKNFSECYRLHDSIGYKHGMSNVMNSIGNTYFGLKNQTKALDSYKKSYEIAYNDSDKQMMCISTFGLANIYVTNQQFEQGLITYQKVLYYIETVPTCKMFATAYYVNVASCLNSLKKPKEAIVHNYKALAILKSTNELYTIASVYQILGESYVVLNNKDSASYYFLKSEAIFLKKKSYDNLQDLYLKMSDLYRKDKNEKALDYFIKHSIYKDSVFNINKAKQIIDIENKYENEKIKKQVVSVSNQLNESKQELSQTQNENTIIYSSLSILFLLLIVIAYLWYKNNKANNILKQKNKEKDALVQEIHHRVKNNLQFVSSLINMQKNSSSNEVEIYSLNDAARRISSMALVHEMLYNQDEITGISIKQYLTELTESINDLINSENLPIQFRLEIEDVYFGISQATALGMITSELISNCIKHAFSDTEKPIINMVLQSNGKHKQLAYTVKDNGCGFTAINEDKNKLGMRLINIFSRQLKAEYTFSNNMGLQFEIKFTL